MSGALLYLSVAAWQLIHPRAGRRRKLTKGGGRFYLAHALLRGGVLLVCWQKKTFLVIYLIFFSLEVFALAPRGFREIFSGFLASDCRVRQGASRFKVILKIRFDISFLNIILNFKLMKQQITISTEERYFKIIKDFNCTQNIAKVHQRKKLFY